MKTRILTGIIFSGVLATSAAQATTAPPIEKSNLGLGTPVIQQVQQVAAQKAIHNWRHYLNIVQPSGLNIAATQQNQQAATQRTAYNEQGAGSGLGPLHAANWQHYLNVVQPSGLSIAARQEDPQITAQQTTHDGQEARGDLDSLRVANWRHYLNILQS